MERSVTPERSSDLSHIPIARGVFTVLYPMFLKNNLGAAPPVCDVSSFLGFLRLRYRRPHGNGKTWLQ